MKDKEDAVRDGRDNGEDSRRDDERDLDVRHEGWGDAGVDECVLTMG